MKDVSRGPVEMLPDIFGAILNLEKAIAPIRLLDPTGGVARAWSDVQTLVLMYAALCPDVDDPMEVEVQTNKPDAAAPRTRRAS